MNTYIVNSAFRIADTCGHVIHLAESRMPPKAIAAEIAASVTNGRFDEELYGLPCFDNEGFISYPHSITPVDKSLFTMIKMNGIPLFTCEQDASLLEEHIIEFIDKSDY